METSNVQVVALRELFQMSRAGTASAGNPAIRSLVFAAVNDSAFLSAGDEIENNFLAAIQPGSAVSFRCRKDQPMPGNNFICAGFAQHSVAAIGLQDQRRRLTRRAFPADLHSCAPIGAGEVTLGVRRKRGEKQSSNAG